MLSAKELVLLNCGAREDSWESLGSNQSILKEINHEYSVERLMLKFQYFGHLVQRANSLEKNLMMGKIEAKRRRGQQRMILLDSIVSSMDMNLSKLLEIVEDRGAWCCSPWDSQDSSQHHNFKVLGFQSSTFFMVQLASLNDYWKNHSFD